MIDPQASAWVPAGRFSKRDPQHQTQITMYSATNITLSSAPVTTETHIEGLTPRYSHISTSRIADTLRQAGWEFSDGTTRRARTPERAAHAAHVLRFRNANVPTVNGNIVEAVLLNSHDGSTAFELGFGIYRIACANGLVVRTATVGSVRLVHSGLNLDNVFTAARNLADRAPEVASTIERWSGTQLDHDLALQMSSRMAKARWGSRFVEADLLSPRRMEDTTTDLWTTFNRVQESVIRGGMDVTLRRNLHVQDGTVDGVTIESQTTRKATAIRGALKQMRLNQDLFAIASEYAWN
jgi:hypothetical protein